MKDFGKNFFGGLNKRETQGSHFHVEKGTFLGYVKDHWTFICCVHVAAQQAFFSEFFCEDTLQPDSH